MGGSPPPPPKARKRERRKKGKDRERGSEWGGERVFFLHCGASGQ